METPLGTKTNQKKWAFGGENKGIFTLGDNNDPKNLGSSFTKGLENFGPTKKV